VPHCGQTHSTICWCGQERGLCSKAAARLSSAWQQAHFISNGIQWLLGRLSCRQEDDEDDAEVGEKEGDGGESFHSPGLVRVLPGLR
jgi:hypothetical protein